MHRNDHGQVFKPSSNYHHRHPLRRYLRWLDCYRHRNSNQLFVDNSPHHHYPNDPDQDHE